MVFLYCKGIRRAVSGDTCEKEQANTQQLVHDIASHLSEDAAGLGASQWKFCVTYLGVEIPDRNHKVCQHRTMFILQVALTVLVNNFYYVKVVKTEVNFFV